MVNKEYCIKISFTGSFCRWVKAKDFAIAEVMIQTIISQIEKNNPGLEIDIDKNKTNIIKELTEIK